MLAERPSARGGGQLSWQKRVRRALVGLSRRSKQHSARLHQVRKGGGAGAVLAAKGAKNTKDFKKGKRG